MPHQNYDIEDFVMDSTFQNYCLGNKEEDVLFWKSWILSNGDKQEKVQQAEKLFVLLNGNNNAHNFLQNKHAFRDAVHNHLHKAEVNKKFDSAPIIKTYKKRNRTRILLLYVVGIAASLLLIVMVSYFRNGSQKIIANEKLLSAKLTYTSMPGERKSFQLPDGTIVLLNVETSIEVSKDFNKADREISLKGEAYFKVAHNAQKPFIIHTNSINVNVLGTEFNVKAYPGDKTTETILIKGSVKVTFNNKPGEKIILEPHHKLVIQNYLPLISKSPDSTKTAAKVLPEKIKTANVTVTALDSTMIETSWIENRLNFNDETLEDVAIKLERWYNVKVSVEEDIARKYKYTGIFENETITEVLKALQISLFFHYSMQDDNIFITK